MYFVPSGGLYFPDYFTDGTDAFVDTFSIGGPLPHRMVHHFLLSTVLLIPHPPHCFGGMSGGVGITHYMSWDGGEPELQDYNITGSD